jgi:hypothetical protein
LHLRQANDLGPEDFKAGQGGGKADRFGQTVFGQAAGLAGAGIGVQDDGAGRLCGRNLPFAGRRIGRQGWIFVGIRPLDQSSPS